MKRIVKFRGKRIDNGEWVHGDLVTNFEYGISIMTNLHHVDGAEFNCDVFGVIPNSVGQLITVKDKVEYYESDIVVVDNRLTALTYTGVGFNGVYFNDDGSWDDEWEDKLSLRDKWELRGNTTDTPELLTKK